MSYLLAQIFVCLLIAGLIGFIIGMLFRGGCKKKLIDNDEVWSEKLANSEAHWKSTKARLTNDSKNSLDESNIEVSLLKERLVESKSESRQLGSEIELLKVQLEQDKPQLLTHAREEGKDNLQLIKGIGQVLEERLNSLGIYHFDQIASWSSKQVLWMDEYLTFPGRVGREKWVKQSKVLALGRQTEFSHRVEKGDVPTSRK